MKLYSVARRGRRPLTPVLESRGAFGGHRGPRAAPGRRSIVAAWGSAVSPPEIVRIDPADARRRRRSPRSTSRRRPRLDWAPLQEFWFTNAQGRRVHSFLVAAPGLRSRPEVPAARADPRRPREHVARPDHAALELPPAGQPGYVVLLTDYRGSTGYGEQFTLDILGDPAARPRRRHQPGRGRGHQALPVHRRLPPGRGRRQLRRATSPTGWRPRPRATSA